MVIADSNSSLKKTLKEANKALQPLLPDAKEPDIFKKIIRGKKQKKQSAGGVYFESSSKKAIGTDLKAKSDRANYRKSSVYKKGTGLSATVKAVGLANNFSEAFIKVDKASKGIKTASHLKRAAMYISRNGLLNVEDSNGVEISQESLLGKVKCWADSLDLPDKHEANPKAPAGARRFIISAPKGTDHAALMETARDFGKEFFKDNGFDYVFVLHCRSDATPKEPEHPHVHFLIKAINDDGKRLNLRKDDLKFMRERYAALALSHGIKLNATSRAVRGKTEKSKNIERFYNEKRILVAAEENNVLTNNSSDINKHQTQAQKWAIDRNKKKLKSKDKLTLHPYQQARDKEIINAFNENKEIPDNEFLSKAKATRQQVMKNATDAINSLKQSSSKEVQVLGVKLSDHFNNMEPVESSQQRRLRQFKNYKSKSFIAVKQRERSIEKKQRLANQEKIKIRGKDITR